MARPTPIAVTGDDAADEMLRRDPLALLLGMLLDQQVPMEWAFRGPATLAERLGVTPADDLDAHQLAAMDPDAVAELFAAKPALHRYPSSMGKRAHALCQTIVDDYGGDAARVWTEAADGADLLGRLRALPGYGEEKARIFVAILAKRFGIRPDGWETAAGAFADDKKRSVADIDGPRALEQVREYKQQLKKKGKDKQG